MAAKSVEIIPPYRVQVLILSKRTIYCTAGFCGNLRLGGATKADFDATIGIHPLPKPKTAGEEFVTLRELPPRHGED